MPQQQADPCGTEKRKICVKLVFINMKPDSIWTARYWQWILSKSRSNNPLKTGTVNEDIFLALPCTGGGEDCNRFLELSKLDKRKDILVPVYCAEYCTAEIADRNPTAEKLLDTVRNDVCSPVSMECILDGKSLDPYYVESLPFQITVPDNNILDGNPPRGTYMAVAAGYWHKLSPLPNGKHVIIFGGTGRNGFHTKVQYTIVVRND